MEMNKNSLFAILLRSPWWISIGVGAGLYALVHALLPAAYKPYAIFSALPFLVIGGYAGFQQLRAPSPERIATALEALRRLSWEEFSGALDNAFRRQGYNVARTAASGADLELTKGARVSVVGCKRWKVARAGVEPLRELYATRLAREAHECIFVATGEITATARAFAVEHNIRLIEGAELAMLLPERIRR